MQSIRTESNSLRLALDPTLITFYAEEFSVSLIIAGRGENQM
jgi:hypothetical protein